MSTSYRIQHKYIGTRAERPTRTLAASVLPLVSHFEYIQLYSPECTLAENININSNKQNKDRNILINTVQLNTRYTFVNVLTKDITEDALGKFPHEFRTPNFINRRFTTKSRDDRSDLTSGQATDLLWTCCKFVELLWICSEHRISCRCLLPT